MNWIDILPDNYFLYWKLDGVQPISKNAISSTRDSGANGYSAERRQVFGRCIHHFIDILLDICWQMLAACTWVFNQLFSIEIMLDNYFVYLNSGAVWGM